MDMVGGCITTPLKKIRVRQLGWWHSQHSGRMKHVPNHHHLCLFLRCLVQLWSSMFFCFEEPKMSSFMFSGKPGQFLGGASEFDPVLFMWEFPMKAQKMNGSKMIQCGEYTCGRIVDDMFILSIQTHQLVLQLNFHQSWVQHFTGLKQVWWSSPSSRTQVKATQPGVCVQDLWQSSVAIKLMDIIDMIIGIYNPSCFWGFGGQWIYWNLSNEVTRPALQVRH